MSATNDARHLDEVVVRINGRNCWLWRPVGQDGYVLDEIVQTRRGAGTAKCLITRTFKKRSGIRTDDHRQTEVPWCGAVPTHAKHRAQSAQGVEQPGGDYPMPFRKRERTRQGFRSVGSPQQFVSLFFEVSNRFVLPQSNRSALQIGSHRRQPMID